MMAPMCLLAAPNHKIIHPPSMAESLSASGFDLMTPCS